MRLAPIAAALLVAAPAFAATHDAVVTPSIAAARIAAVDPTGTYDWAIEAGGQTFTGSLVVTKVSDTTYAATIVHGNGMGEVKAKSVKLTNDHLVVISETQYGDLTMDVKIADPIEAAWSVGDGTNAGPLKIVRRKS